MTSTLSEPIPNKSRPSGVSKSEHHLVKGNSKNTRTSQNLRRSQSEAWEDYWARKKNPLMVYPAPDQEHEYLCSISTLRKLVLLGCALNLLCLAGAGVFWSFTYFVWPLTFAREFQSGPEIFKEKYLLMILALEPLYNLIFLLLAVIFGTKRKCFVRLYYVVSPWLLILIGIVGFQATMFVGNFSKHDLERKLSESMETYWDYIVRGTDREHEDTISHEVSKQAWNDLQNYLECCGIKTGAQWMRGFLEPGQTNEWLVPESCCMIPQWGERMNCTMNPNSENIWPQGCLDVAYNLFMLVGWGIISLCFAIALVTIFCIITTTEFYSAIRRGDGTEYVMNFVTYFHECCFFGCACFKRKEKSRVVPFTESQITSEALESDNEIILESESSDFEVAPQAPTKKSISKA